MTTTPSGKADLDTIWRRNAGKEHVRVERVWYWPDQGWTVRAHPIRGGRVLIADHDWFLANYTKVDPS